MTNRFRQLQASQGFRKYFANVSWLLAERVLRIVIGLSVGIWVARYLGPEEFGIFSYALSFVALFSAISTLGLDSIVVREMVKDESRSNGLVVTAFWLKFFGAAAIFPLLATVAAFTSNDSKDYILILAIAFFFQSFNTIDFYFQAKVKSKFVALANIASLLVSSAIRVVLILNEASLIAFVWIMVLESALLAVGLIYFYIRISPSPKIFGFIFDSKIALELLNSSWPLILSATVISIYMKIDQVMIKQMLGAEAVGHYAAAARLSEAWYFIPTVIASSLFPAIVNSKKSSDALYISRIKSLYTLMVVLALAIAIPISLLSDQIIELVYGPSFQAAASVLTIHIWSGVFVFLGVASGYWLIAENHVYIAFYRNLIGALVSMALNLVLIPMYGIAGAAISTVVAWISSAFICDLFYRKTRTMFLYKLNALSLGAIRYGRVE